MNTEAYSNDALVSTNTQSSVILEDQSSIAAVL